MFQSLIKSNIFAGNSQRYICGHSLTPEALEYFDSLLIKMIDSKCLWPIFPSLTHPNFLGFVDDCLRDDPESHVKRVTEWTELIDLLKEKYSLTRESAELLFNQVYAMIVLIDQQFEQYHDYVESMMYEVDKEYLAKCVMDLEFFSFIQSVDDFSQYTPFPPHEPLGLEISLQYTDGEGKQVIQTATL